MMMKGYFRVLEIFRSHGFTPATLGYRKSTFLIHDLTEVQNVTQKSRLQLFPLPRYLNIVKNVIRYREGRLRMTIIQISKTFGIIPEHLKAKTLMDVTYEM